MQLPADHRLDSGALTRGAVSSTPRPTFCRSALALSLQNVGLALLHEQRQ